MQSEDREMSPIWIGRIVPIGCSIRRNLPLG
jgi:hypothetical protein